MSRIRFIRNAARALIIHHQKLLVIHMRDGNKDFYILPGGGQRPGETLHHALKRECREEIGCEIRIGNLLYVREYLGKNHQFAHKHRGFHQVEVVFQAALDNPEAVCPGLECDKKQIGVCWLDLAKIQEAHFYPGVIRRFFKDGSFNPDNIYLGDCN